MQLLSSSMPEAIRYIEPRQCLRSEPLIRFTRAYQEYGASDSIALRAKKGKRRARRTSAGIVKVKPPPFFFFFTRPFPIYSAAAALTVLYWTRRARVLHFFSADEGIHLIRLYGPALSAEFSALEFISLARIMQKLNFFFFDRAFYICIF